ncbi:MAG TPA: ABC transporter substrate-binding protein [Alphaproteobacteria bacterium]|nr:ABC transporter substrate-binding protein [Alphaproteobacteria bacterium]
MRLRLRSRLALAVLTTLMASSPAWAEEGVTADRILLGQVAALDGPSAALGQAMRQGLLAAFAEANRSGGIKGRRLDLVSLDDGYDPNESIAATRHLIEDDKVFALIGAVGTPTSVATQPLAEEAGVPFIGAFTGAPFLRDPGKANVVNVRASYLQETETMVERLTKDLGVKRIAIFYQDDTYGRAGLAGLQLALSKRDLHVAAEGTYERNTTAVKAALLAIRNARPEAVIMIGTYRPCAEFIKLARAIDFNPVFVNISFVGSEALAKELGPAGAGVVVTQVVPFPDDVSLPVIAHFRSALKAVEPDAEPGFVSLEGYIAGRLMVMALNRVEGEVTREALLNIFARGAEFDLGGIDLKYGPGDNQGSDEVFLTVLGPDGRFKPISNLTAAAVWGG